MVFTLIIQLSVGSTPFAFAAAGDGSDSNPLTKAVVENKEHVALWDKAAQAMESGAELPNQDPNPFSLGNQSVEINGRTYSFNDYHVSLPPVSITGLRVVYDEQNKRLVLEGLRGQNDRGLNGTVVARHFIPDVEVAAMVRDEEILTIVDSKGSLHVVSMDYVAKNIFSSPIPVFKNLWTSSESLEGQKLSVHIATPGLRPPEIQKNSVVPLDEKGNIHIESGDLFVFKGEGSQRELVGAFSRKVTYEKMIRGFKSLQQMVLQIYPANVEQALARSIVSELEGLENKSQAEMDPNTMPAAMRRALLHISNKQMLSIGGSIHQQQSRVGRQFHLLVQNDWEKTFDELEKIARAQSEKLGIEASGNQDSDAAYKKSQIDSFLEAGDLSTIWQNLYRQSTLMPTMKVTKEQKAWVKKAKEISFKYLAPMMVVGAAFGVPYAYEHFETLRQVQALTWMYENAIPDVVKEGEYRLPLFASTVSLLALWPGSVSISWAMGRGLKALSAAVSKSTSKIAQGIRDVAKQWVPLTNWQRITSFGMRFYGNLIYPAVQTVLNKALRQPTMISAWNQGLNPFKTIAPGSVIGQKIGLKKPTRAGVLNPFSRGDDREQVKNTQLQIQAMLAERKLRIENLSLKIATLVVAEKEKVDPATIDMIMRGALDPAKLEEIFKSKDLQREWERTQDTVARYLDGLGEGYFDQDTKEISRDMVAKHYAYAKDIVKKIKEQNKKRRYIDHLWHQSRIGLKKSRETLFNLGVQDSQFLKTIFTNKYVSEQTERGFVSDHLMVVLIMAFIGERADLSDPRNLAANANEALWTNPPHWSDVGSNTYAHFFVAGSKRALVFQSVKPEDSSAYEPVEYLWTDSLNRREGIGRTAYQWVRNVIDPRRSDIGQIALKTFFKRLTTIQAAFVMTLAFRMGLGGQDFGQAMLGWLLFFFAGQWYYAWPWDVIDRGTHLEGERIEEMKMELKKAFATVSQGLRDQNQERSLESIREGQTKIFELMKRYNPKALELLTKTMSTAGLNELHDQYKSVFNQASMKNLSQMARLYVAIQSGDESKIQEAASELKEALASGGNLSPEVEKLNASALLQFSLKNSPVFTSAHPSVSWVAVFGLGAVLTTILAIPLSVKSFDPNFLSWGNVGFWAAVSLAAYWLYNKTLSKNGWAAQGLNRIDAWWAQKKLQKQADTKTPNASPLNLTSRERVCVELFATQ